MVVNGSVIQESLQRRRRDPISRHSVTSLGTDRISLGTLQSGDSLGATRSWDSPGTEQSWDSLGTVHSWDSLGPEQSWYETVLGH